MTDPFTDVADELLTRPTDMGSDFPAVAGAGAKTKKHVCPYCGAVTAVAERPTGPCPRCSMDDTPATRAATKSRIGPWYVLQSRNPSAPGMKWATLLSLVSKGQVTPRSVVRGPTTHQLWKFAAHVKGLSREFNLCYSCGGEIDKSSNQCPHCDRLQEPPVNPDTLLETRDMAAATPGPRAPIQREIRTPPSPMPSMGAPTDVVLSGPAPMQADEPRRPMRNPDDGILSAKELAAAFQLDFNPQVQPDVPAAPTDRPPRRKSKALVLLILLAAVGAGAALYMKPEYRAKTTTWLNQAFASSKHYLASSSPKKSNDPSANKPAAPWEQPKVNDSTAAAPAVSPNAIVPPAPTAPDVSANTATQTNNEAVTPAPVVTSAPNPAPPVSNTTPDHPAADSNAQVDTTPAVVAPASAQPVAQNPAPPVTPVAVQPQPQQTPPQPPAQPTPAQPTPADQSKPKLVSAEQALKDEQPKLQAALDTPNAGSLPLDQQSAIERTLYLGAHDAEAASDLKLAVQCYKKIQELDSSVRHTDVQQSLTILQTELSH